MRPTGSRRNFPDFRNRSPSSPATRSGDALRPSQIISAKRTMARGRTTSLTARFGWSTPGRVARGTLPARGGAVGDCLSAARRSSGSLWRGKLGLWRRGGVARLTGSNGPIRAALARTCALRPADPPRGGVDPSRSASGRHRLRTGDGSVFAQAQARTRRGLFAVFLQDPRTSRDVFDLIWVPEHDALRGPNVIATLTSPHPVTAARLAQLRASPDPRLGAPAGAARRRHSRRPEPRRRLFRSGPSAAWAGGCRTFSAGLQRHGDAVAAHARQRCCPRCAMRSKGRPSFVWDGTGDNPYAAMLALADMILVTADSANMVGEATATGAPVYVFSPAVGRRSEIAHHDRRP